MRIVRLDYALAVGIFGLTLCGVARASEWYEDKTFLQSNVSNIACDVITSPFTKWITGGLKLEGHPATGKLYARMTKAEAQDIMKSLGGQKQKEEHPLIDDDSKTLAKIFREAADRGVPFYVQIASGLPGVSPAVGLGMTVMDYLIKQYPQNSVHPAALAEVTKYGGNVVRILSIANDKDGHPWVGQHIVLVTSINQKPAAYVLCSSQFALKVD